MGRKWNIPSVFSQFLCLKFVEIHLRAVAGFLNISGGDTPGHPLKRGGEEGWKGMRGRGRRGRKEEGRDGCLAFCPS